MWFFIGLFTVVGAALFFSRWRIANHWKGETATHNGSRYLYNISRNKGRIHRIKVGVDCTTAISFCLKPENWLDRFFKGLGLSEEQQLNRLHFDENIYVISDDKRLTPLLKYHPTLHQQLASLFEKAHWPHFTVTKLWCQQGRLWLDARPLKQADNIDVQQFAQLALPTLQTLTQALSDKAPSHSGSKDYFIVKAAILLGISSALALNGGVQLSRLLFLRFPVVLDHAALLRSAITLGLILLVALLFSCVKLLGRTSRAHLVLLELLFVGGFGCISTAYMELRDYNIEYDSAAAQIVSTAISERYTTRCGKRNRSTCYHLTLAPWDGYDQSLKLQVDYDTYDQFHASTTAQIAVHTGAIDKRWIAAPTAK